MGAGTGGASTRLRQATVRASRPLNRFVVPAFLALAVGAFSGLWRAGALVLDGPGMSLFVRLSRDHVLADGRVPYWLSEMWSGTPVWALVPSLPVFLLVPVAAAVDADVAVKIAVLALQVVGGWGAFVLARSLWGRTPATVLAGLVYALHPLLVAHGALGGSETSAAAMAATPWAAWSLRRALRGEGTRYVVGTGLVAALAVLHQAEYAWPLAVLFGCMLAVELGRVRNGETGSTGVQVVARMGAAVAVSVGVMAHWLLPFLALGDQFVGSPSELVQGAQLGGVAGSVGRELGAFLDRSGGLEGAVSFDRLGLPSEFFYLSWVCVALTFVTIAALARRRDDVYLTAVLVASAVAVWMSSGTTPLAGSGSVGSGRVPQLVLLGAGAGLLLGAFVKRLHLGRLGLVLLGGAAVLVAALPYLSPMPDLHESVPILASLRFPRFHLMAVLGLALGAAYPVTLVERWMSARRAGGLAQLAPLGGIVAAVVTAAAFLVDVAPYRSHYRVRPPASGAAYAEVARTLASDGGVDRVAVGRLDPRSVTAMLAIDRDVSMGWPHRAAGKQLWRVAGEPYVGPPGYREAAYGLTATKYLTVERPSEPGTAAETIPEVALLRNPRVLPRVRAYAGAVAVGDPALGPVLAASLAHRNIGVVTGAPAAATLGRMGLGGPETPLSCGDGARPSLGGLAGEVGIACALHPWLGPLFAGSELTGNGAGAVFPALAGDLQGVSVWLDRPPGRAEVALHDVAGDGRSLGAERARGQAVATDEYGLATFPFDRIPDSAGKRFAFVLSCPGCPTESTPRMVAGPARGSTGNLIEGDRLVTDRVAAFTPLYQRLVPAAPATTAVRWARPASGKWRIETSGARPALVVVADARFPGWRATVDGRPEPVLEADGAFVGVPVEAGNHVITLEYGRPAAATAGRLVTGATLLTIVAVGARRRHRRLASEAAVRAAPAAGLGEVEPPSVPVEEPSVPEPVVPVPVEEHVSRLPPGPAAEAQPAAAFEPEPADEVGPEDEPEPAAEIEPEPELEPELQLAPALAPETEPAAALEQESEPEPAAEPGPTQPQGGAADEELTVVELIEPTAPTKGARRRRHRAW